MGIYWTISSRTSSKLVNNYGSLPTWGLPQARCRPRSSPWEVQDWNAPNKSLVDLALLLFFWTRNLGTLGKICGEHLEKWESCGKSWQNENNGGTIGNIGVKCGWHLGFRSKHVQGLTWKQDGSSCPYHSSLPLWWTKSVLLKMSKEIVDLPIKNCDLL
jgi:hypothetical protein